MNNSNNYEYACAGADHLPPPPPVPSWPPGDHDPSSSEKEVKVVIGAIMAVTSGACIALSMVVQRYALAYPRHMVRFFCCDMRRSFVWIIGFLFYLAANGLFAMASLMGPLSLNATLFTLLLVWNLIFARGILHETLTPPRTMGAVVIVIGAGLSVLGTPVGAKTDYTIDELGELVKMAGGTAFLVVQVLLAIASAACVLYCENIYGMMVDEAVVNTCRSQSTSM